MDDKSMAFKERERQFSRGGGDDGGSPNGFFSIRTNVYSRQCYSDPNNPGKMICKETKDSSGFDPFNKDQNYKNSRENIFTQRFDERQNQDQNYHQNQYQYDSSPSVFEKL